ncbi:DNA internalization-related competence protein ComEC/Rec2 [Pelotalea chapellei]|uniref:DNA internalization-related competence protein ComEC/Rec2 n=1 Tax=Pelotalea chapellei TaxID=44671 RepID=A0ABS5U7N8_9BACT|nr:DNA internalization-related competence protein ComEC/Rec2 [Pelotalea chapellei]MBT1071682.1 DNA internalization-related competence protein ComEC/Rec2 [Pelotalea chapellei]
MFNERPLLIPFVAFASGIYVSDLLGLLLSLKSIAAVFGCLLLACYIRHSFPLHLLSFLFFFVYGLHALTPWKTPSPFSSLIQSLSSRTPVAVEGIISSRPVTSITGSSFVVHVDRIRNGKATTLTDGKLQVFVTTGDINVMRGDRILLSTRLHIPHKLGLPGEFDYARYLELNGIAATGRVASADDIVLIRGAVQNSLLRKIDLSAHRFGDAIRENLPDNSVSSVMTALLIGDQKRIPQQLNSAYTRAGVNHILSISGFHIGIIAFFVVQMTMVAVSRIEYLALSFNLRRCILLLALPAMVLYLVLTGAAPATTRSVIMLITFVMALYAEREVDAVNTLLLSALVLISLNPPSLFDISFQLSFIALWGIVITVAPVMERIGNFRRSWMRTLFQFVVTSCAASFATIIPVLFAFNQASLNGILANFLIVPLLGYGAVLTGFCALPMIYIYTPIAHLLLLFAGKMVEVSNFMIIIFGSLPLIHFHGITTVDMFFFLTCLSLFTLLRPSRMKYILCALLPVAAVVIHLAGPALADGRLHVTMLSVGQAESILIRFPEGSTMLVDGGGYLYDTEQDFGERILAPALRKLGVNHIDRLIMTHDHPDHSGGLPFLIKSMPVGEFWEPATISRGANYNKLCDYLAERQVPRRMLVKGDSFQLGDKIVINVLSPSAQQGFADQKYSDANEESLVFQLVYGEIKVLFTADAGFSTETKILTDTAEVASTLLKVGHHGSRFSTSDKFLDHVNPSVAIISAGLNNNFSLPSLETLQRLHRRGIATYRTDRDGTIEFISDGKTWNVATPFRSEDRLL